MLLFIDVETGGLNPDDSSLLEIAAIGTDMHGNELFSYHAHCLPDDQYFKIWPEALKVNNADLTRNDRLPLLDIDDDIIELLIHYNCNIPIGWNVQFDLSFIKRYLRRLHSTLDRRAIDLCGATRLFQLHDLLPKTKGMSLEKVATEYGLLKGKQQHTAMDDALLTLEMYKYIKHYVKP